MDKSKYWYDYNRNDPDRENPFTDAFDYMMGEAVVGGGNTAIEDDGLDYEVDYMSSSADYMSDIDDQYAHYYTCLLYTSPSPRDATLSRMPSSA